MKRTGVIRRVDDLGRIMLPKEVRRCLAISDGTPMEILYSDDGILLKKYCSEEELSGMVGNLMEAVEEMCVDLGPGKTGIIRGHLRNIQSILNQNG